jgi:Spy/CpxP family protein refolding chaperone
LQNEKLKKHFNLTEDQAAKLQKIADEQRSNFQRPRGNEGNADRPAGPPSEEDIKKFTEEREKHQAETKTKINEVLTPEQQEKFKVLPFQLAGGLDSPFLNTRSFEFLNLTDEQKAKLKKLDEENQPVFTRPPVGDNGQPRRPTPEESEKRQKEAQERNTKIREGILSVLTPEQKTTVEKLTAEAKQLELQPQRGGERGNRDGRGEGGGRRGGSDYRPNGGSWTPGSGTPNNTENSRRPFPRSESATTPPST